MKEYKIEYENQFMTKNPLMAAKEVVEDIVNGLALMFTVTDLETNEKFSVDLSEMDEDAVIKMTE